MKNSFYITLSMMVTLIVVLLTGSVNLFDDILFFCNLSLVLYCLFGYHSYEAVTLHKVVNLFILIFFIIAITIQFKNDSIVTSLFVRFTDKDYTLFQVLLFFIILIYNGTYSIFYSSIKNKAFTEDKYLSRETWLILLSLLSFLLNLYSVRFNFSTLLFRGLLGENGESYATISSIQLIISHFIRPIPNACLMAAIITNAKKKCTTILLIISLIAVFPTSLSRNAVAMYWLPIVLLMLWKLFRKENIFLVVMFVGYFVIFPFMDNFRYFNGKVSFKFSLDYLNTMNFDSGQNLLYVIKNDIVTNGRQLLGALLFFVPRRIWPNKPIGSGAFVAGFSPGSFSNISMPYFGEGYVNFGYLGVLFFTLVISYISAKMDKAFWKKSKNEFVLDDGYFLIMVGSFTFILRGDLMSSIAYTSGFLLTYFVISKLCVKVNSRFLKVI